VEERLDRLGLRELVPLWRGAIVSAAASAVVWIHGDLHPRNIVTRNGALAGIIDWGDLTAGDVAADLASAWMLLDRRGRSAFWEAYQPTDDERSRALGWAVNLASAMVDSQEPNHVRIGRQIVEQLTASD
jgi:aminoglycoside phosphotransferase (APT) family kinase protein